MRSLNSEILRFLLSFMYILLPFSIGLPSASKAILRYSLAYSLFLSIRFGILSGIGTKYLAMLGARETIALFRSYFFIYLVISLEMILANVSSNMLWNIVSGT